MTRARTSPLATRPVVFALAAACLLATVVTAGANHGAAGDPNLALLSLVVDGEARQGACTRIKVRVRNTSSQVSVTGVWGVTLRVLDERGDATATLSQERIGLGHRWEDRGGGMSDKAELVFEGVKFPDLGTYRLQAVAALASTRQKEYGPHDNASEVEVTVASACPPESNP